MFFQELYSQAYDEVGVLFAACPNFYDHYTEDTVNNNGMEWMRFLNEILSDYDDLLNEPRFRNIIKIKTIGPTYMAASGMNLEKPVSEVHLFKSHFNIIFKKKNYI
jgi:adenylate cyclase 3